ncbi:exonuclease domain-containing protein [Sutcliffiella cohnii]|uniref:exonuclease domain-containing protein n=1 Tax=Sutcliffiella cohnii TaxID=33932 RepID=UPI002E20EE02|nr:exonuclease domain-containing protein [Sutcliffiella cohnii]MED4014830.1 exonuclease domain-containing protein [Sutcliffiella cohnii]
MNHRYVVLDLETTGNSPKKNEKIIQVGAVLVENGEITERFASFVNPGCSISPFIEHLTGISNELVKNAPTFSQIAPMLIDMLEGASLVAHNVPFDLSFLQYELKENGFEPFKGKAIDTVELSRILLPTQSSYKLTDLATFYSFTHDNPHRADSDAEVTAFIFLELLKKIEKLPVKTVKKIRKLCKLLKSDVYYVFKKQNGSEPSEELFFIYESVALKKIEQRIDEAIVSSDEHLEKNEAEITSKVEMLLHNREHALLEIPKTIEWKQKYIAGITSFVKKHKKKVLITANTPQIQANIHLLLQQDNRLLATIIKDKSNYLNIDRFVRSLHAKDNNYDTILTKAQILVWLTETETGDVEELSLTSGGRLLWDTINCRWEQSIYSKAPICYFQQAVKKMTESDIIITDHFYFIESLQSEEELLLECEYVVIDETNSFIKNVRKYYGINISYLNLHFILSRLEQNSLVESTKEELNEAFTLMRDYCLMKGKSGSTRSTYTVPADLATAPGWGAIQEAVNRLLLKITELILQLERASEEHETTITELVQYQKDLKVVVFEQDDKSQTWLEADIKGAKNAISIRRMPIEISEKLAVQLFQKKSSVLLLDQSLQAEDDYQFIINELGLSDFYPSTYSMLNEEKSKVTIHIPTDTPLISEVKEEEFIENIALQLKEITGSKGGKIIASFSSVEMIVKVYEQLKDLSVAEKYVIISQSNIGGSKQKILKNMLNFEHVIVLVSHRFFEEVSMENEELGTLVIARLPFHSLDEPLIAAKIKNVEAQDGNSFKEVSLPLSILRFKYIIQAFIHQQIKQDCIILDARIAHKKYGDSFIKSLPNWNIWKEPFYSTLQRIKR